MNLLNKILGKPSDENKIEKGKISSSNNKRSVNIFDNVQVTIIDVSPNLYLVHRAARICVNKPIDNTLEERKKYIKRLAAMGHESPLEHSNIVAVVSVTKEYIESLLSILEQAKYVNTYLSTTIQDGRTHLLIGGSIRGFIHLVREFNNRLYALPVKDSYNKASYALEALKEILYLTTEKEFLISLSKLNLLDEDRCNYELPAPISTNATYEDGELVDEEAVVVDLGDPKYKTGERVDLVYAQDVYKVARRIKEFGFNLVDAYKVCTMSFVFHNVSRSCANQMTRHRVAISQESQRYCKVDTSDEHNFVDPVTMQADGRYKDLDRSILYDEDGVVHKAKKDMFKPYDSLLSNGIVKEDARAWLPMNVTTKLMMTFNYKNLIQFIDLRMSPGAQYEVRLVAQEMKKHLESISDDYSHLPITTPAAIATEELVEESVTEAHALEMDADEVIETTLEDMKPLDIKSEEGAKAYIEAHEELLKIKEEDI